MTRQEFLRGEEDRLNKEKFKYYYENPQLNRKGSASLSNLKAPFATSFTPPPQKKLTKLTTIPQVLIIF